MRVMETVARQGWGRERQAAEAFLALAQGTGVRKEGVSREAVSNRPTLSLAPLASRASEPPLLSRPSLEALAADQYFNLFDLSSPFSEQTGLWHE